MLGLQSEISIQGQVSRLSVSSNPCQELKAKISIANVSSTMNSEGLMSSSSNNNSKNEKIKHLRNKLQQITRNQQMMDMKMKTCVSMIQKELKKKEEQNRQLQNLIISLKEELSQSRGDLEILTTYVVKKLPNPSKEQPKSLRTSNNNNTQQIDIIGVPLKKAQGNIQKQPKSASPKTKIAQIEKTKNPSPIHKQQKKLVNSANLPSPFYRKLKSPNK